MARAVEIPKTNMRPAKSVAEREGAISVPEALVRRASAP